MKVPNPCRKTDFLDDGWVHRNGAYINSQKSGVVFGNE